MANKLKVVRLLFLYIVKTLMSLHNLSYVEIKSRIIPWLLKNYHFLLRIFDLNKHKRCYNPTKHLSGRGTPMATHHQMEKLFGEKIKREPDSPLDEAEKEEFDNCLGDYLTEASHRTNNHVLLHDKKKFQEAKDFMKDNIQLLSKESHLTTLALANISLLGVLNAGLTGTYRIYLQTGTQLRNEYGAPNFNLYANENYSVISEGKQIDFAYGDSLGLEKQAVMRLMKQGDVLEGLEIEFAKFLPDQSKNQQEQPSGGKSPFTTPEYRPPGHAMDDEED